MATFINEQSEEDFVTTGMFSFTSHTMGKQEERKKSDRKTGKERRKAEKTLRSVSVQVEPEMVQSVDIIWCIGHGGHWGNPMLDDVGCLVKPDFCADCQRSEDKLVAKKSKPAYPTEDEIAWMSAMEYQLDMMELAEQEFRLDEERQMLEKIHRMHLMNLLLKSLEVSNADPYDDYIPEIDDDFDF